MTTENICSNLTAKGRLWHSHWSYSLNSLKVFFGVYMGTTIRVIRGILGV